MHVDSLRVLGRAAQGVRLINLKGNAAIAAVARVPRSEEEDEDIIDENLLDSETSGEVETPTED
jgi:DNA gyrase subunit A